MAGMAFGFGFGSFNWGKHIDKIEADKKKGVGSLPVRLGERAARWVNIFTVYFPMYCVTLSLSSSPASFRRLFCLSSLQPAAAGK